MIIRGQFMVIRVKNFIVIEPTFKNGGFIRIQIFGIVIG